MWNILFISKTGKRLSFQKIHAFQIKQAGVFGRRNLLKEKNTEAEITEPEVPKTEAWTESTEGYTEAGETEDASGIMYGGAKFAYLDSVLERIDT